MTLIDLHNKSNRYLVNGNIYRIHVDSNGHISYEYEGPHEKSYTERVHVWTSVGSKFYRENIYPGFNIKITLAEAERMGLKKWH